MSFERCFCETDCWRVLFKHLSTASLIALRKTCKSIRVKTASYSTYRHAMNAMSDAPSLGEEDVIFSGLYLLCVLNGDNTALAPEILFITAKEDYIMDTSEYQTAMYGVRCYVDVIMSEDAWNHPEKFIESIDLSYARNFLGKGKLYVSCIESVVKRTANLDITRHYLCQRIPSQITVDWFTDYMYRIYERFADFHRFRYSVRFYHEINLFQSVFYLTDTIHSRCFVSKELAKALAYIWNVHWLACMDCNYEFTSNAHFDNDIFGNFETSKPL